MEIEKLNSINCATIEYRLDKIEETLSDVKEILVESKLQRKDIEDLNEDIEVINGRLSKHSQDIDEVKNKDVKKDAGRWRYIIDYLFKFIVAGLVAAYLGGVFK